MSDIVERLKGRGWNEDAVTDHAAFENAIDLMDEAAAEITKLRAELAEARKATTLAGKVASKGIEELSDTVKEIAALKAELAEAVIKPFADEFAKRASIAPGPDIDHWNIGENSLTLGDLRKAAAWLEGRKG